MNPEARPRFEFQEIIGHCHRALVAAGASEEHASCLARAAATAEAEGNRAVGLIHLIDYLDALEAGRILGDAEPELERVTPIITRVDAGGGMQHLGVERAFDPLVSAAREFGLAAVASRNGFTIGALSYFPRRLAEHGLVGMAFANAAPAIMPASGGTRPRFCTNPMAFAVPTDGEFPIVIDQSSTATALVAIKQAADRGESIPEGWALGPDGESTTDPVAALAGVLLPFGGARGANIALTVELMAVGLTGADWSWESAAFNEGSEPPSLGYFLLAIDPEKTGGPHYRKHVSHLVAAFEQDGAFVPGIGKGRTAGKTARDGVSVDPDVWERIGQYAS